MVTNRQKIGSIEAARRAMACDRHRHWLGNGQESPVFAGDSTTIMRCDACAARVVEAVLDAVRGGKS